MAGPIASAAVQIVPTFGKFHKDTRKALQGTDAQYQQAGKRQGDILGKALKGGVIAGGAAVASAGIAAIGTAVAKGFQRLDGIDQATKKLEGLGHSAQTVDQIMENALASVKGTAFGLDEAATVSAQMVAAGIKPGQELEKTLRTVADSATIAGIGMDEMGAIFGKVASSGRLQGDELNQMSERGIPALQMLADHLGVTTDEVRKMVSAGEVDFKTFAAALEDGMGGAAMRSGETFQGAWKNTLAALGRIGATFLKPLFEAAKEGMNALMPVLDQIGEAMKPLAEELGKLVQSAMPTFVTIIKVAGGAVAGLVGWLAQNIGLVKALAGIVTAVAVAYRLWNAGLAIHNALSWASYLWASKEVILGATRIAITKGLAAAQASLNAAMAANPIGLVLIALVALGAALVVMYKKVGWFRDGVNAAWAWIKSAIGGVVQWFTGTAVPWLKAALAVVGQGFQWLWASVIKPVFGFIQAYVKVVFTAVKIYITVWWTVVKFIFNAVVWVIKNVLAPAFTFLWNVIKVAFSIISTLVKMWWVATKAIFQAVVNFVRNTLAPAFTWLWTSVIKPVLGFIKMAIAAWWASVKLVFQAVVRFVKATLGPTFTWWRDYVITPVWNAVKNTINSVWTFVRDEVFNPLMNAVKTTLPAAFRAGKDAIGKAWDKLRDVAKKPVRFVVQTIMNDGLIKNFNNIAKHFPGAPKINEIKLPRGFARGGWTGPGARLEPAGIVHADEFVIQKRSRRRFEREHPGALDYLNRTGRLPVLGGYAGGGRATLTDSARWWQQQGARVSEFGAWGQRVGRHSRGSLHYSGRAYDVNYGPGGQNATEMRFFDSKVGEFKRLFPGIRVIWRAPGHYNHLHADNSGGADIGGTGSGGSGGGGFDLMNFLTPFTKLKETLSELTSSPFGKTLKAVATKLIGLPVEWIKSKAGALGDFASKVGEIVNQGTAKAQVRAVATAFGWGAGKQWQAIDWLVNRESSWNPKAANPRSSARGLFQKMTSAHGPVEATAGGQAGWGLKYIKNRYGTPVNAMNFHKRKGWYDQGGLVKPMLYDQGGWLPTGLTATLNATGKPEAVFTRDQLKLLTDKRGDVYNIQISGVDTNNAAEVARALRFEMARQARGGKYAPA